MIPRPATPSAVARTLGPAEFSAAVLACVADAVVVADDAGRIVLFNAAAERLYGVTEAGVVGRRAADALVHLEPRDVGGDGAWPHHPDAVAAADAPVLDRHRRGDGTAFDAELRLAPVRDAVGVAVGVAAVVRDVSAQLAGREGAVVTGLDISALRRGEADSARLAALVQAAPDAIVTEDGDAVIATWNPGAERMFGLLAEQAVGRPYDAVVLPDGERAAYRGLRAQVREGRTVTMRMCGRRADGSVFPIEVSVAPLRAAAGSRTGAVAIVRDISELVEAELELRERASRLERSNADLEEFAYAASHDLQEPLRSIKMGTETVLRAAGDRLQDDERALLAHVDAAATRMSAQVTALMELARVALGDAPDAPVPVQLPLNDALDAIRAAIREAGAIVEVHGTLPSAAVPRVELTLLLQNLLANAIKYRHPDRRPRVTVSGTEEDGHVEVRIADNGIGLSEADRVHIFAIFGRAHPGVPGTGMGLALCRRIVERRSGSISVASAGPGHGAEFTLRLPAGRGDRPA